MSRQRPIVAVLAAALLTLAILAPRADAAVAIPRPIDAINRFQILAGTQLRSFVGDSSMLVPHLITGPRLSDKLVGATNVDRALGFLNTNKDLFGLSDARTELRTLRVSDQNNGGQTIKFQQMYNGLPVKDAMLVVSLTEDGIAEDVGGLYLHQVQAIPLGRPSPKLTGGQALEKARGAIKAPAVLVTNPKEFADRLAAVAEPTLMYMVKGGQAYLAYRTEVDATHAANPAYYEVMVDANTGAVLSQLNIMQEVGLDSCNGVTYVGEAAAPMHCWQWSSGTHDLYDKSRTFYGGPTVYAMNAQNTWSTTPIWVTDADGRYPASMDLLVSPYYYAGLTVDYFAQKHRLTAPWPGNKSIKVIANYGPGYVNAYYNGNEVVFGNGNGTTSVELGQALDVVAHEIAHGVISNLAGLVYSYQSGALNESYADTFATIVEYYSQLSRFDWKLGEDVWTPATAGDALRYMDNPSLGGQPKHMANFVTTSSDNGGVHTNSGIPNYVFYRAVVRAGGEHRIGDIADIWYRALDVHLVPTSNFAHWAAAIRASATYLNPALYSAVNLALQDAGL